MPPKNTKFTGVGRVLGSGEPVGGKKTKKPRIVEEVDADEEENKEMEDESLWDEDDIEIAENGKILRVKDQNPKKEEQIMQEVEADDKFELASRKRQFRFARIMQRAVGVLNLPHCLRLTKTIGEEQQPQRRCSQTRGPGLRLAHHDSLISSLSGSVLLLVAMNKFPNIEEETLFLRSVWKFREEVYALNS
jgi:hypothetical protein